MIGQLPLASGFCERPNARAAKTSSRSDTISQKRELMMLRHAIAAVTAGLMLCVVPTAFAAGPVKVGNGWDFSHYFVGDWTGDSKSDLIVRTASGDLLLYPFANGTFY